jgi:hypothetical protein
MSSRIHVWTTSSLEEIVSLSSGHTSGVFAIGFSPNGERLVTASEDRTIKVWDARLGQLMLTLRGHEGGVGSVFFAPNGRHLVTADHENFNSRRSTPRTPYSVRVWDARPLTEKLQVESEARGLVRFLFEKLLSKDKVMTAIRDDQTISEPLRQAALASVAPYYESLMNQKADRLVGALFGRPMLRAEVKESITSDPSIDEPVKNKAIALVDQWPEDSYYAHDLNEASWAVVKQYDRKSSEYAHALRFAEKACTVEPSNGLYVNTLGVAQYRAGKYRDALATLTRSDKLNSASSKAQEPTDVAFLAMANYQFGQKDKAREWLRRLRDVMKQAQWQKDRERLGFLREAEQLIEGR